MEGIIKHLEPYKIQDTWAMTIRYYNDTIWLYYSMIITVLYII